MRDIFFEDEIDYFHETAKAILIQFLSASSKNIPTHTFLFDLVHEIERSLNINILMSKILNIHDLMIEDRKNRSKKTQDVFLEAGIVLDPKESEEELNELLEAMKSLEFKELTSILNNLVQAAVDKPIYLSLHREALDKIEKKENQYSSWIGESRLILALKRGNIDKALDLISRDMYIERDVKSGMTPLVLAAQKGLGVVVKALLEKKVFIDACTKITRPYMTALYHAIERGHQAIATILVSHGAKLSFEYTEHYGAKTQIFSISDLAKTKKISLEVSSKEKELQTNKSPSITPGLNFFPNLNASSTVKVLEGNTNHL